LNVMPINIPALRERREDIPALAQHFLGKYGDGSSRLSAGALDKLLGYEWPGNVRELENVIERSLLLAGGEELKAEEIRIDMGPRGRQVSTEPGFLPTGMTLDEYEKSILKEALKRANGNKSQAARLLGITRNALRYRLGQIGIEDKESD
jgi:DNA-binding NtrC family response regulator